MVDTSARRTTAALAIGGAVFALVGNGLAPRYSGDDVAVYRDIADSTRFAVADVLILVALLLVTAAFVGISRGLTAARGREFGEYGRLAAGIGGGIAILQVGLELFAYRQQAKAFAGVDPQQQVPAFWATNSIDHASAALFATWTIVLLGIAPALLGAAQARSGRSLGYAGVVGGLVCVVVGVGSLLTSDQSSYDIPFAIGSVIVTLWLLATGVVLWRSESGRFDEAAARGE